VERVTIKVRTGKANAVLNIAGNGIFAFRFHVKANEADKEVKKTDDYLQ